MKTEERQELEKNDLEDALARGWAFFQKYGTHVLLVAALLVLGFQLYRWYLRNQDQKLHEAWTFLNDAPNATNPPGRYRNVIADYSMPDVQALAYAGLGDFYSEVITFGGVPPQYQGVTTTLPEAANEARTAYQQVLTKFPNQTLAVLRARFGLGKLAEADGDFAQAGALYQQIADQHPKDAFGAYARYRLEHLGRWASPVVLGKALPVPASEPFLDTITPEPLGPTAPALIPLTPSTVPAPTPATAPATAPGTQP